jgi:imidazolonepropionase-like amidohydrolase
LVRRLVKEQVDFVKVMATGGRMTPGSNVGRAQFTLDELQAIVDDSHRLGRRVAAHCLGTEGIALAVEAGVDTVEHGNWYDESGERHRFDEGVAQRMAERGVYWNMAAQPNRALAEKPPNQPLSEVERRRLEALQKRWLLFRRGVDLGIRCFASTDAIYGQWPDTCDDLRWLVTLLVERGGIPAIDALRMVTATPAAALGLDQVAGTLAPCRVADLLVVRGVPLHSIRALHAVEAVYQAGRLVAGPRIPT